jgi:hypothetical protein
MKKYITGSFLYFIFIASVITSHAQNMKDTLGFPIIGFHYEFDVPVGSLSTSFGVNSKVGASFWYKTNKNWIYGLEYSYIFGDNVKVNPFDSIQTSEGYILNSVGEFQDVLKYERGHFAMFKAGKIIKPMGPNANSGICLKAGAGFWLHQVYYYFYGDVPVQVSGNYMHGYDRLTYGPALAESIGYLHFSTNHRINFSAELEFDQGFTQSGRVYNYDTRQKDNTRYLDMTIGLKVAWYFPIFKRSAGEYYY